ncbi:endonuclease [Prevotella sp. P4-51]|uniref:endonuclease/exonuclease/phosphatase family protein n=1 Tax=Prevotella sp. P4-51 TaxID=2024228 RepID=UPI000B971D5A|nr:endonuclease/exonuclease/phosphatase family protein [Prevotella sp. P4-51]OYP71338.1 endonuclease [Prevotella sp. P4-51]
MKRYLFLAVMACMICLMSSAQKKLLVYGVGFYNQENLFDTIHDEGKRDFEFLPNGSYRWDGLKYSHKLKNMSKALADMGTDMLPNVGCAIIGVSEVENARVLTDLCAQEPLKARNMQFCHIEGPDKRGVDCALLYNPALFKVNDVKLHPYVTEQEKDKRFITRGFLTVKGELADEPVVVIVAHLPSRFSTSYYRELGARQMRVIKDSLLRENPAYKFFIMGDMNDDPFDKSMVDGLGARADKDKVGPGEMYSPWINIHKQGKGTLFYGGSWNLFDQIIMTPNLLMPKDANDPDAGMLKYRKAQIFRRDYLFQSTGKYKGAPKRTTAGGVWLDGYSDHLPVVVYLSKQK